MPHADSAEGSGAPRRYVNYRAYPPQEVEQPALLESPYTTRAMLRKADMQHETRSCVCKLPQDELWGLLTDYANVIVLGSPGSSAVLSAGNPRQTGCTYAAKVPWKGSVSTFEACLVNASRPSTITWRAQTGLGISSIHFDLKPIDALSTTVSITSVHDASSAGRVLEAMAWGLLQTSLENTVVGLSRLRPGSSSLEEE